MIGHLPVDYGAMTPLITVVITGGSVRLARTRARGGGAGPGAGVDRGPNRGPGLGRRRAMGLALGPIRPARSAPRGRTLRRMRPRRDGCAAGGLNTRGRAEGRAGTARLGRVLTPGAHPPRTIAPASAPGPAPGVAPATGGRRRVDERWEGPGVSQKNRAQGCPRPEAGPRVSPEPNPRAFGPWTP
jgi:hypothetical protein